MMTSEKLATLILGARGIFREVLFNAVVIVVFLFLICFRVALYFSYIKSV